VGPEDMDAESHKGDPKKDGEGIETAQV